MWKNSGLGQYVSDAFMLSVSLSAKRFSTKQAWSVLSFGLGKLNVNIIVVKFWSKKGYFIAL